MSSPAFARLVLGGCALVFAGAGLAFLVAPVALMSSLGADLHSVAARSDVRALFGGMELGIAAFLGFCLASPERLRIGLIAATLAFGGILAARLASLFADGLPAAALAGPIAIEAAALCLAALAVRRLSRAATGAGLSRAEGARPGSA